MNVEHTVCKPQKTKHTLYHKTKTKLISIFTINIFHTTLYNNSLNHKFTQKIPFHTIILILDERESKSR